MTDSARLIGVANELTERLDPQAPDQQLMRRAISTAYYAVFHRISREGADLLAGPAVDARTSKAWLLIYRAFNHGLMARRCAQTTHPPKPLVAEDFSASIRAIATEFRTLQDDRHRADYDPLALFLPDGVKARVQAAAGVVERIDSLSESEARLFITFLLFGTRDGTA